MDERTATSGRWRRATVAYALVLLAAAVVDPPGERFAAGPLGLVGVDAWLHLAGYALLALLVARARDATTWPQLATAATVAAAYGLVLELVQMPISARTASLADAGANALGAVLAVAVLALVRRRAKTTTHV